jgi:ATP phosphoribosyltransferase
LVNGLKEVETVLKSEAVLIASHNLTKAQKEILRRLNFRFNALLKAKRNKYILLNAPNDNLEQIISLIPGMKSPTVVPLAKEGWSSVHSVLEEDQFWEVVEKLQEAGAQGILVVPIEKMII